MIKKAKKDAKTTPSGNKLGYIAGTDFSIKPSHNEKGGVFYLQERRERVAKRYLEGWNQWEIAREEKVDQATIHTDLKVVMDRWQARMIESFDEHKRRELAKIDHIERIAIERLAQSMGVKKVVTKTVGTNGEFSKEETKVVKEKLVGDPRWMDQIKWCIEMRCKILGITKENKNVQVAMMSLSWEDIASVKSTGDEINQAIIELEELAGIKPESTDGDENK